MNTSRPGDVLLATLQAVEPTPIRKNVPPPQPPRDPSPRPPTQLPKAAHSSALAKLPVTPVDELRKHIRRNDAQLESLTRRVERLESRFFDSHLH